ncbi:hypothetical protein [Streptomyces carpinensis]|uniref:hypothetical protein n=1 Tax=Streptomyces carpinensis TaxID=66369 RepID=UPI001FC8F52B|nr:hypothetical protein [Streptomyces carpinensis]
MSQSSLPSSSPPFRTPSSPPFRNPDPVSLFRPGADAPATCEVPHFPPVRVRGGRCGLRRLLRHRRRAVAAGLAVTAAALVAAGPRDTPDPPRGRPARGHPAGPADASSDRHGVRRTDPERTVTVPVRLADAATVRLLRPGDRVDVIAAEDPAVGGRARVVARGARVARLPEPVDGAVGGGSGALVVLSVPRSTAARLAGAGATARLAVTLW